MSFTSHRGEPVRIHLSLAMIITVAIPSWAQTPAPRRTRPLSSAVFSAERVVKQAAEELTAYRKVVERDVEVLSRLRAADAALTDPMQPSASVQEAVEEVAAAKSLHPESIVMQGVIAIQRELESAKLSPGNADFGRLRSILRDDALEPASRVAVRNALRLEEQALEWIKIQELITAHLRVLSEITGESLRATQRER